MLYCNSFEMKHSAKYKNIKEKKQGGGKEPQTQILKRGSTKISIKSSQITIFY